MKREYKRKRYKNMSKENRQKLRENQENYHFFGIY